ncbi:ribonuclease H-like domain-containing protein [Clostridium sp. PL3]|uniref:Ribonuclease H-like domain-containing protein n=1 Tax=Clostridium thailandense TaxID=2794346 RepID=A0A949TPU0_9CLOT|nr:ribonuclease H-like domain-containing protein [Clostridium thailandense]MBV7276330.1 ribonuclease H-like domain-containing protein [Clostridium thailandense]
MIERQNIVKIGNLTEGNSLVIDERCSLYKEAIFFDLEHYIYKKPICIGVFGCCYFSEEENILKVTQYMIENKNDVKNILFLAKDYFNLMQSKYKKKYIVTFSGNNDFTVINYLFKKYNIEFDIEQYFFHIDLQKQYEKEKLTSIGLKALEVKFNIFRDTELISGSNLAKTFSKIIKDNDYITRMPKEKKEKILLYNEQDVVSLFHIYTNWNNAINNDLIVAEE